MRLENFRNSKLKCKMNPSILSENFPLEVADSLEANRALFALNKLFPWKVLR